MLVISISSKTVFLQKRLQVRTKQESFFPHHIYRESYSLLPLQGFLTFGRDSSLAGLRMTSRDVQFFQQVNLSIITGFAITEAIK